MCPIIDLSLRQAQPSDDDAAACFLHGEAKLDAISIANAATGELNKVPAAAVFIFIGAQPRTDWVDGALEATRQGLSLLVPTCCRTTGLRPAGTCGGNLSGLRLTYLVCSWRVTCGIVRSSAWLPLWVKARWHCNLSISI